MFCTIIIRHLSFVCVVVALHSKERYIFVRILHIEYSINADIAMVQFIFLGAKVELLT